MYEFVSSGAFSSRERSNKLEGMAKSSNIEKKIEVRFNSVANMKKNSWTLGGSNVLYLRLSE